jgi:hypothetical protein
VAPPDLAAAPGVRLRRGLAQGERRGLRLAWSGSVDDVNIDVSFSSAAASFERGLSSRHCGIVRHACQQ